MANTSKLFSSYQLQDIALLSLHLDVTEAGSGGRSRKTTVTVKTAETTYNKTEDGLASVTKMTVDSAQDSSKNEDQPSARMHATIAILYLSIGEGSEDEMRAELRRRSLSDGYSFIRNQIMCLTNLTPIDRFLLPSIEVSTIE